MQEITRRRSFGIGLRARFPLVARIVALVLLAAGIGFVGVSYYKLRKNEAFKMIPKTAELSKEVTGIIEAILSSTESESACTRESRSARSIANKPPVTRSCSFSHVAAAKGSPTTTAARPYRFHRRATSRALFHQT